LDEVEDFTWPRPDHSQVSAVNDRVRALALHIAGDRLESTEVAMDVRDDR
jgi:hypothetical protein